MVRSILAVYIWHALKSITAEAAVLDLLLITQTELSDLTYPHGTRTRWSAHSPHRLIPKFFRAHLLPYSSPTHAPIPKIAVIMTATKAMPVLVVSVHWERFCVLGERDSDGLLFEREGGTCGRVCKGMAITVSFDAGSPVGLLDV